ncbi:hypothetical protein B447_10693 [Thauera sp. 27]|uniref:DUF7666 domain-containing protein n=1 Tax=Thauera sp. 27 TaxID=305700 RepID=UPI0002CDD828|nr:hypothetical protein [Thauera sp. 27]ENO80928.1 hypothetical protein B447_10693 [Thauera sp. 27]
MTQAEQHDATPAPAETTAAAAPIRAYKAFDQNLQCRGFQFEVGKTYEHDGEVAACKSGFHACENPLDVWNYYPLDSRYAVVDLSGAASLHSDDSKIAAARITISAEIALPQIISDGVSYLMGLCKAAFALKPDAAASGYRSKLAASGDGSKLAASGNDSKLAASGNYSQLAASGDGSQLAASGNGSQLAASGNYSQLAASGDGSQLAASGNDSKLAASGNDSKLAASGNDSKLAASGDGSQLAASGNYSQLAASGYRSQLAASGYRSKLAASGDGSVCVSAGLGATARAGDGGAIALTYYDGTRYRIAVAYVGENDIEPHVNYRVNDAGEFVRAQD